MWHTLKVNSVKRWERVVCSVLACPTLHRIGEEPRGGAVTVLVSLTPRLVTLDSSQREFSHREGSLNPRKSVEKLDFLSMLSIYPLHVETTIFGSCCKANDAHIRRYHKYQVYVQYWFFQSLTLLESSTRTVRACIIVPCRQAPPRNTSSRERGRQTGGGGQTRRWCANTYSVHSVAEGRLFIVGKYLHSCTTNCPRP